MLGPATGAGEPVPAAAGLPGQLLALLWPVLVLGVAVLLVRRRLRRGPVAGQAREEEEEEEEEEDGPAGGRAAGALPARQAEEQRRTVQVPVNGQLIILANTREKKLLKSKKKRKAQCSDKEVPKHLPSVEKDKVQEEEGVWQTKISSREKRHLRKERLKQKDPTRASLGNLVVEPAFDWDKKGAVWPLTEDRSGKDALIAKTDSGTVLKASGAMQEELLPSRSEEDVFSNVGTWDIAEVKSCPVTFGTLSELSRDLDDPSAIDLDSDWKAPMEEWGNWTGDEEHQAGDKKEKDLPKGKAGIHFCFSGLKSKTQRKKKKIEVKEAEGGAGLRHPQQGLEVRMEEGPRDLIPSKHTSDAVHAPFKKSLDVADNSPSNDVPGKKERRKRKKMKKET